MPRNLTIAALMFVLFAGADWPQFRGPGGSGISDQEGLPVTWNATENVRWKTALPGAGASSPITVGQRIFVTCYSGYGLDQDAPGQEQDLGHHVVCVDTATGNVLWDKATPARLPEQPYGGFLALHGYASGTPASDGQSVYAFFGRSGVYAYDLEGNPLWHALVGDGVHDWGSGTSPILVGDLVVVNASVESGSLVALRKSDGKEAWRVPGIKESWSTPAVLTLADGSREIVVSLNGKVLGIEPATGRQLWQCDGVPDYVCPAVVCSDGLAYVTGGRKPVAMAIRGGGRGDVSTTHKLWEVRETPKVPTPLVDDGYIYWINDAGIACCLKADTGEVVYQERISGLGRTYASLVLADGKLYTVGREKGAVVLAAGPIFSELARNDLGDPSIFNATPTPADGCLLLRSDKFLYCVGE